MKVLDKGLVRLVDYMGNDLSVVRAARVSYNAAWRTGEDAGSDKRLIKYLWKNKHTTPFEAVVLTFEVKAPIFVLRQWHRHRTWSYNELSGRYKEFTGREYYIPEIDKIGTQSKNNKQGREFIEQNEEDLQVARAEYVASCEASYEAYENLIHKGWPKELARAILPVAAYSHMFATTNLRNLFHFLDLRLDEHAQYEIREYAKALLELTKEVVPVCCEVYNDT